MAPQFHVRWLCLALFLGLSLPVFAGDLDLSGSVSWQRSGTRIDISAGRVTNHRRGGISGTLRLQIWATTSPYYGGGISGYIMGTRSLGQLEGGWYLSNITGSVPFRSPPPGRYYTTMTLEEYTYNGYVIVDYVTFDGTISIGGVAGGGGSGGGFNNDLNLAGNVSWSSIGSRVTFRAGEISNDRPYGKSGSLRLRLWATSSRYYGGNIYGYVLGTKAIGRLNAGYHFLNFVGSTSFRRPR